MTDWWQQCAGGGGGEGEGARNRSTILHTMHETRQQYSACVARVTRLKCLPHRPRLQAALVRLGTQRTVGKGRQSGFIEGDSATEGGD